MDEQFILNIKGLRLESVAGNVIVDNVDLQLRKGEIVGLVGESGSGKSVLSYALLGISDAAARISSTAATSEQIAAVTVSAAPVRWR